MKKLVDIQNLKKVVVGVAFAALAFGATTSFASEPACAAEVSTGTAIHFVGDDETAVVTIMGKKDEVLIDFTRIKRQTIAEGKLVFAQLQNDFDTDEAEAKLVLKRPKEWYDGFIKSIAIEGNTNDVENQIQAFLDRGYELVDLESWGIFYENGGKTRCEFAKKVK